MTFKQRPDDVELCIWHNKKDLQPIENSLYKLPYRLIPYMGKNINNL